MGKCKSTTPPTVGCYPIASRSPVQELYAPIPVSHWGWPMLAEGYTMFTPHVVVKQLWQIIILNPPPPQQKNTCDAWKRLMVENTYRWIPPQSLENLHRKKLKKNGGFRFSDFPNKTKPLTQGLARIRSCQGQVSWDMGTWGTRFYRKMWKNHGVLAIGNMIYKWV